MDNSSVCILDLERGFAQAGPIFSRNTSNSSVRELGIQETLNLSDYLPQRLRKSQVSYVKGKEDYILFLNSDGKAIFHVRYGGKFTCFLSEPGESSLKIMSDDHSVYLILTRPDGVLRFYRFEIDLLSRGQCLRTRILKDTRFTADCLKQVDLNSLKVVIQTDTHLEIWDLSQDFREVTLLRNSYDSLWYSKRHLVKVSLCENGKLFEVVNLDTGERKGIKLAAVVNLFHVEIISDLLVVWDRLKPILVVSLINSSAYLLSKQPAVYIQTELLNDSLVVFRDGTAQFVSSPNSSLNLKCRDPCFTDNTEILCVLSCGQLTVISKDGKVITKSKVNCRNVSCLGINEDTEEVYLGLKNGLINILI